VFIDASSSSSGFPRFSSGRTDFMAQRTAIAGTEVQWGSNSVVSRRFLWTWDVRPYPYWPDLKSIWADNANWTDGPWVQGKLGLSHVAAVLEAIVGKTGLDLTLLDSSTLQVALEGFIISQRTSARAAIEQLMRAYFFSIKESNGQLVAVPRDGEVVATIDASDCIPMAKNGQETAYVLDRQEDLQLPQTIEVQSYNRLSSYEMQVNAASRGVGQTNDIVLMNLSLVLSDAHGDAIAQTLLSDAWAQRSAVTFQLPVRYAALEPGDVITLQDDALSYRLRVQQVQFGKPGMLRINSVIDASDIWDGYIAPSIGGDGSSVSPLAQTHLEVLDIPALPSDAVDALTLRFAMCGGASDWSGASLLRVSGTGEDAILLTTATPATMGTTATTLGSGTATRFDRLNTVDVILIGDHTLSSVTEAAVLNGANAAVIGDEVIQFTTATLIAPGKYRLSNLLRGRLGTEHFIGAHFAGDRFVLLDEAVLPLTFPTNTIGNSWTLKPVTFGASYTTGASQVVTIAGNSLAPLSPVMGKAVRGGGGDVTFTWLRRTRINGNLADYVDIPLNEASEIYDISVLNGSGAVLRSWQVTSPSQIYTAAQQTSDFGSLQSSYQVQIDQRSALVGPGNAYSATLTVQ